VAHHSEYRSSYPGKTYRLRDAAENGQLVVVTCGLCRRAATYLASDLVQLLNPERDALEPPFPCSRCGKAEYVTVKLRLPSEGDWGSLVVRRPRPIRRIRTWRWVKLGDEAS
jgi:hypothetical protein